MRKYLIAHNLIALREFKHITSNVMVNEPRHSHHGLSFVANILKEGESAIYYNCRVSKKNGKISICGSTYIKWCLNIYQTTHIIAYQMPGCLIIMLSALLSGDIKKILILFSGPPPTGSAYKQYIKRKIYNNALLYAEEIFAFSSTVKIVNNNKARCNYTAVTADVKYYRDLHDRNKDQIVRASEKYIIVVGDDTRDDQFIYDSLIEIKVPIIRITRDQSLINKIEKYMNVIRGDIILSRISFVDLYRYYATAKAAIYVSRFDAWQPAGATSIAECLACGGIAIAEGNGVIENDYKYNTKRSEINTEIPVIFFDKRNKKDLERAVIECIQYSKEEIVNRRNKSIEFANKYLDVDATYDLFRDII
ncbi:MAG: hypothetical protein SFY80_12610 [Verrucomicrobiota bacterium]|nr:hypothetical protein [Verrucomicrobiota bacterium]